MLVLIYFFCFIFIIFVIELISFYFSAVAKKIPKAEDIRNAANIITSQLLHYKRYLTDYKTQRSINFVQEFVTAHLDRNQTTPHISPNTALYSLPSCFGQIGTLTPDKTSPLHVTLSQNERYRLHHFKDVKTIDNLKKEVARLKKKRR